ncbi:MAG: biotin/lipoyl-binding protein, partial [Acidobacteriota bacterium]|nr:biotin/lipoyl-binding protein [Acidobacteriota bacterium]
MRFSTYFRGGIGEIIFTIAAMSVFLIGCGGDKSAQGESVGGANQATKEEAPIAVTTAKTESRDVPAFIQATGSLIADETSDIAPKTAGKIINVSANVGEFVGQGSVIAKIDDRDARLRLAEAEAGVTQAIAGVRQAEARLGLSRNGTFSAATIPEVLSANAN